MFGEKQNVDDTESVPASFMFRTAFLLSGGSCSVLDSVWPELLRSPLQISKCFHSSLPAELHTSGGPCQVL